MADGTTDRIADALDGRTVATAESVTAGRMAAAFAATLNASQWFRGGVVAYQTEVKRQVLGVSSRSVFCEEAAAEMARAVCDRLGADVAVATSGVAGTDPVDGVEPGTVFVGTVVDGEVRTATHRFDSDDPASVCAAATERALLDLLAHLERDEVARPASQARNGR
jgi:nicotinamide-nucleotide amidase